MLQQEKMLQFETEAIGEPPQPGEEPGAVVKSLKYQSFFLEHPPLISVILLVICL